MAKRHHSARQPERESHGSPMHGYYAGPDDRRRMERQDGSMLNEDRNATANMPQDVKYHKWPHTNDYLYTDGVLDDTGRGVDRQIEMDLSKARKHFMPKKV